MSIWIDGWVRTEGWQQVVTGWKTVDGKDVSYMFFITQALHLQKDRSMHVLLCMLLALVGVFLVLNLSLCMEVEGIT